MPAARMNAGSWHVGATSESSLSHQSVTNLAIRATTSATRGRTPAQTRTHSQTQNNHSNSRNASSGTKDDSEARPAMMRKNLITRSKPSPPQSSAGSTPSREAGDRRKKALKRNVDKAAGFDGGPTVRRRVQKETGAVPVPVPVKGSRPGSVGYPSIVEIGNARANQVAGSSSAMIDREGSHCQGLHWKEQRKQKPRKVTVAFNHGTETERFDKSAWDAERQKKAAALKKIGFSKVKKVKKEEEEEDCTNLRVGRMDGGGGGEAKVREVNGKVAHSLWTWDGQGNIPGLSASTRIHLPQATGVVDVETKPIPPPSLFPDPTDDEDLYSPKEVDAASGVAQVKEEQREHEDVWFDSPIPLPLPLLPDSQTSISTINSEQDVTCGLPKPALVDTYPLDTECTIHPKNKRKQQNLSHTKNFRSPKKVKTDVGALNVGEGQSESNKEVVPHESTTSPKKRGRPPKKTKGKEREVNHVITIGREAPLTATCVVETQQGEIPTGGSSQTRIGEKTESDESTGTSGRPENAEQDKRVEEETKISSTSSLSVYDATGVKPPTPDSVVGKSSKKRKGKGRATENGADEAPRGKRKIRGQTTEAGEQTHDVNPVGDEGTTHPDETPKKKRKVKDQATEGREGQGPGAGPAGEGEESRLDEMPGKWTKMNGQTTEGGKSIEWGLARDENMPQPEETPEKRRKEKDQKTTEGGEKTQGSGVGSAPGDDIPRLDETPEKKRKATDQSVTEGAREAEKKVVKRGRPPKNREGTNGETSCVKETGGNGPVKEVKEKTKGRKKRATMDEKDGMKESVVRKKRRLKLALEEGVDGNWQSEKSTMKWTVVCKNSTAARKKASRRGKGKEKVQSTGTAPGMDVDKNDFKEAEDNAKTRKTLRPSIWASSKTELLLVLPELSGSKCFNGITEGSSNFPMVMLDESTAEGICVDVRWFDDEENGRSGETASVRLTLARDFVCPVAELASTVGIPMDSAAHTASSDAGGPSSDAMTHPTMTSSVAPGPSSIPNANGNGCGIDGPPFPVALSHDDNVGIDLEYIDEDAPQGGAIATFSAPSVEMSPVYLTPTLSYVFPVAQEATTMAHISHNVQSISQAAHALQTCHPLIQIGHHDPPTLSMPSTVLVPSLYHQQLFYQDQIPLPQHDTTVPVPVSIPAPQMPVHDEKPSPPILSELKSKLDTIIPPSPPPEIEILISSWRLSLPLILISSHETFNRHFWAPLMPSHSNGPGDSPEQAGKVGLAAEHAYVFLGFFRVVKMDQRRVTLSDEERVNVSPENVVGRVEWTFDVEWVPGYDESKGNSEEFSRPWWAPDFVFGRPVGKEGGSKGSKKGFTWLERHAQARLNLVPTQLVDGQEDGSSDEAMPKGWLCKACGKLNQKMMMRHRWCGSRVCRDNPLSRGYAVDLCSARDANQTPLALPISTCDRRTVNVSVADWDDGMRTLKYRPMSMPYWVGNTGAMSGILKHVFTCNLVDLQREATPLFESIQSEVCLMKSTRDSGPFFKCHVSDSYANERDQYAFSCLTWNDAPQSLRDAQDLITFMGKKYGEEETLDIDQLTIVGWVSSGTRKTPTILAAREHTITMLCLGNDVVLTIIPKWEVSVAVLESLQTEESSNLSYPPYVQPNTPDTDKMNPTALPPSMVVLPHVADFTPPKIQSTLARMPRPIKPPSADGMQLVDVVTANDVQRAGAISEITTSDVVPGQITIGNNRSKPVSKVKPKPKEPSESMSVTLVHGDMLLFSGCDFEYSIKRMGTSILVIGSKEGM